MLTTLAALQLLPNLRAVNQQWLAQLLNESDAAIKGWTKRDLELTSYAGAAVNGQGDSGYYSGLNNTDIVLRQYPVLNPTTAVASGSNGVSLPTGTINVGSTTGFNPSGGTLAINLGTNSNPNSTTFIYTGVTSTTFTGCTGGTGTLATDQTIGAIAVWFDQKGLGGQFPGGFSSQTLLTQGLGYYVPVTRSFSGISGGGPGVIRRAGNQAYWGGGYGWGGGGRDAKLSASRLPCWPQGEQNIKVAYLAGYATIPPDLAYACQMLISYMVRVLPVGGLLQSENIGSYGYSVLGQMQKGTIPDPGNLATTLARYRDSALGGN